MWEPSLRKRRVFRRMFPGKHAVFGRQWRSDLRRGWDLGQSSSLREPGLCERLVLWCLHARRDSVLGR